MRGKSKGFTLVELSVVIAILAVLLVIAVPRFSSAREDSAKEVCHANRAMIAKTYQLALTKDSSITLQNFIDNPEKYGDYYANKPICPLGGIYTASSGKIVCSHPGHDYDVAAANGTTISLISNNLMLTIKALENLNRKNDGRALNSGLKEALSGTFLEVEDYIISMAFGNSYTGDTLTWRTDTTRPTEIYFAGDGNSDHSNWSAYLVVVDGVLYKTKATNGSGTIKSSNVAQLSGLTGQELLNRLNKDFVKVGPINIGVDL